MTKIRLFEAFSGIGTQSMALNEIKADYEVVAFSEIDKYAIDMYCHIHNIDKNKNLGDISKINEKEMPDFNLMTYSFPCFVKGTLVLTDEGFKNIEDIKKGDLVLTHTNTYKKVVKPMINKTDKIYQISTSVSEDLLVTSEHPFYVREKRNKSLSSPIWVETKDLNTSKHLLGLAINKKNEIPIVNNKELTHKFNKPEFWWLIGKFINNGISLDKDTIIVYDNNNFTDEINCKLDKLNFKNITLNTNLNEIKIKFNDLGEYCKTFQNDTNKFINKDILSLPKEFLKEFLKGYFSLGGYYSGKDFKIVSYNKNLAYSLGQCYMKAYEKPFELVNKKSKCSGKSFYEIFWKASENTFYEDGYIWCPIESIQTRDYNGEVYNFEVEEDNSYVVQNIIVHNCQDLSMSGKQRGIIKGQTRSGLLWECERIISHKLPKVLLMENVKNLLSVRHKPDFDKWCKCLENLGYTNYYDVLNAKDHGIPQNRQRVFMISVHGDHKPYKFPEKKELHKCLRDIIDLDVDPKFYMDKPFKLVNQKNIAAELDMYGFKSVKAVQSLDQIAPTLTTCQGGHRQAKILLAAELLNTNYKSNKRIFDVNGISGTLCARDYKGPHKILTEKECEYLVRKLTPIEYWRLTGIKEDVINKALLLGQSNSQMYKQAGNAIVVNVLEDIFKELINII